MPLDPQTQFLLQQMEAAGAPPLHTLPIPVAREVALMTPFPPGPAGPLASVENGAIPGPAGDIPVRIYTPEMFSLVNRTYAVATPTEPTKRIVMLNPSAALRAGSVKHLAGASKILQCSAMRCFPSVSMTWHGHCIQSTISHHCVPPVNKDTARQHK